MHINIIPVLIDGLVTDVEYQVIIGVEGTAVPAVSLTLDAVRGGTSLGFSPVTLITH